MAKKKKRPEHKDENLEIIPKRRRRLQEHGVETDDIPTTSRQAKEGLEITPRRRKKLQECGVGIEDIPTTPRRAIKLLTSFAKSRMVALRRLRALKTVRESKRRIVKKNAILMNIINDLKRKEFMETESLDMLSSIGDKNKDLLVRLNRKHKKQPLPKKYPHELRKFALTLHFLSPRAYKYVRTHFDTCLPHPKTISRWYQGVDCEPGFTKESFEALKIKSKKQPIIGALAMDEMAIRKCVEWDGHISHGYVNVGNNVDGDNVPLATEALTFMLTCVNGSFKIPVGYFLIDGISGLQKAELVRTCLDLLAECDVTVVTLTFDGAPNNIAMAKHLGCNLDCENLNTQFQHNDLKISILLDPCHCLKLVRNTLGDKQVMYNQEGKEISFKYFELLHQLQTHEQLHLANKLRQAHIDYVKQKMKVKLAAQLLSKSVSDALMFCRNKIKLEEFANCEATSEFITMFNNLFDLLNTRNLNSYGYKQAILPRNLEKIYQLIENGIQYIKNLKFADNTLVINSQRKIGFLGFIICLESLKNLCSDLLQQDPPKMSFICTYKLSQDHVELFFGAVRSMGGFNNNPSAKQFRAAYKKLLVHAEFKAAEGNCIPLEDIPILNFTQKSQYVDTINNSLAKHRMLEHLEEITQQECVQNDDHCYLGDPSLTEYAEEVIYHISGFVVKHLQRNMVCEDCLSALKGRKRNSLTSTKDKGGLIYPSDDVYFICKLCEKILRKFFVYTHHSKINNKDVHKMIRDVILHVMHSSNYQNIFRCLNEHQLDFSFFEDHKYLLIKSICEKYLKLRIHFVMKSAVVEKSVRNFYNKLVLFKGH